MSTWRQIFSWEIAKPVEEYFQARTDDQLIRDFINLEQLLDAPQVARGLDDWRMRDAYIEEMTRRGINAMDTRFPLEWRQELAGEKGWEEPVE